MKKIKINWETLKQARRKLDYKENNKVIKMTRLRFSELTWVSRSMIREIEFWQNTTEETMGKIIDALNKWVTRNWFTYALIKKYKLTDFML